MRVCLFVVLSLVLSLQFAVAESSTRADEVAKIFVGNEISNDISVMSFRNGTLSTTTLIAMRGSPFGVALSPDNKRLYVACANRTLGVGVINIYDTTTLADVGRLDANGPDGKGSPFAVAITRNGKKLYASNRQDHHVYVYDLETNSLIKRILPRRGQWPEWAIRFVALSPNDDFLYVTGQGNSAIYKIDTGTDEQVATIPDVAGGRGMAFRDTMLYIANEHQNLVTAINTQTDTVAAVIPLDPNVGGTGPQTVALNSSGTLLYVAMAFGQFQAIDVDPNSPRYNQVAYTLPIESSQYHYGVSVLGDYALVTTQADRGRTPNSLKIYGPDPANPGRLRFLDAAPTLGTGPYLATSTPIFSVTQL